MSHPRLRHSRRTLALRGVGGLAPLLLGAQARRAVRAKRVRFRGGNEVTVEIAPGVPVNTILFPMEGDPMAASEYWQLARASNGSFLSPSTDWP